MKKRLIACLVVMCMLVALFVPASLAEETPNETSAPLPTEETVNAEPTEEPVEESTEEPAEEPTEVPTEEPVVLNEEETEEPTEVPTEEPTEVPTEEPTEEPTEVPTEEPTEEPTEVPTEEPTEVPTEEPTEVPTEEPTEEPTTEPTVESTVEPTAEPTVESTVEPTTEPTVEPSVEPTEEPAELTVVVTADTAYAFTGKDSIGLAVEIAGGVAPYSLALNVGGENVQIATTETGSAALSYMPAAYGDCVLEVVVTDMNGTTAVGSAAVIVAEDDRETEAEWTKDLKEVELTGDWRVDLVAVAATQIDYMESQKDFVLDSTGFKHGYTRYGDWYGEKYAEWCAMFVSFCANYAEIPANILPHHRECSDMKNDLSYLGAYEDEEYKYVPQAGDLIFFHVVEEWEEKDNEPAHIGIVEKVTDEKVTVIEGNVGGMVVRNEYELSDRSIVGYANVTKLMDRAGKLESEEIEVSVVGATAYTNGTNINMRADASTSSDVVVKIEESGSELTILGAKATGEFVWYEVQYGEYTGYIRSDLLVIVEPTAEPTVEPSVEPTAEPSVEPTVEPTEEATEEATELPAEIVEWMNSGEVEVTDEMVERALKAGSVDAMVIEGDELIHVRTGEAVAHYNAETGELIDKRFNLVVAIVNLSAGDVTPAAEVAE